MIKITPLTQPRLSFAAYTTNQTIQPERTRVNLTLIILCSLLAYGIGTYHGTQDTYSEVFQKSVAIGHFSYKDTVVVVCGVHDLNTAKGETINLSRSRQRCLPAPAASTTEPSAQQ